MKCWPSLRNAVTGVAVTVRCAVTRTAAVFVEPPVSQHAAFTAGASDAGLTSALPAAGVAERGASRAHAAYRVAGTRCREEILAAC